MINKNFKFISYLLMLIIILILNINNQKEKTKLKLIVWETPSSSLGNYLSISTVTGFLISYLLTSKVAKFNQSNLNSKIKYKTNTKTKSNNSSYEQDFKTNELYDNTLIERDIKDPSPTVNARFRVIGNTSKKSEAPYDCSSNETEASDSYFNTISQYDNEEDNYEKENRVYEIQNDWEDEKFLSW